MVAGDTVIVTAGTYAGFDLRAGGVAGKPITFRAQGEAIINARNSTTPDGINLEGASHIVIEGFQVLNTSRSITRAGIRAVHADHVVIRKNTIDGCGSWGILTGFANDILIENNMASRSGREHGIYFGNSADRPVIRGNTCWGNNICGIHLNGDRSAGGDGIISDARIENNVIYDNGRKGGSGINGDGVQNSRIQNNVLYNNHGSGISLYRVDGGGPSIKNVVVNNTVVMSRDGRWALNLHNGSTGNTVYNNILLNLHSFRGSMDISEDSLEGLRCDHNVVMERFSTDGGETRLTLAQWRDRTKQDGRSVVTTPAALFHSAGGDPRLTPGSPAIDAGTTSEAPARDRDGNPRPQGKGVDIGAFESPGTGSMPASQSSAVPSAGADTTAAQPPPDRGIILPATPQKTSAPATPSRQPRAPEHRQKGVLFPVFLFGLSCIVGGLALHLLLRGRSRPHRVLRHRALRTTGQKPLLGERTKRAGSRASRSL